LPTLTLFTLSYLVSLVVFHHHTELPKAWLAVNQHWGSQGGVLVWWGVICILLSRQGGMCATRQSAFLWILLALFSAQMIAGVQAAAHKNMQVPLGCNKQIVQSEFKLLEKAFRDQGAQTWLIKHSPTESALPLPCLADGAKIQLFVENSEKFAALLPGHYFQASLRLKPPKGSLQLEGFDVHRYWFANQIAGTAQLKSNIQLLKTRNSLNPLVWMEQLRLHIAEWILSSLHHHPEKALVLAMVVGDQGLISAEDRELFNSTGIAHLVAISGLHITLFAMLAGKGMGLLWRRSQRLCLRIPAALAGSAFGLLFAILYGLVAGWGVPAQRTVFMLAALFVGQLRGGTQSSWDTFFLALFLTLAFDSWAVLDAGFILSFGAVATLVFVTQGHYYFIKPQHEFVANAVKAQYTVTVGLILPCAWLFNQQSIVSPVVNALSIPWMSFVSTPLALLGGLLQQGWALLLAANSLTLQREWLLAFNELSWATLPIQNQPMWINLLVALGCIVLIMPRGIVSRWIGLALVGLLAWPAPRPDDQEFWLTLMDVGQGTAIAIQTKNHLLIYDAGPAFNDRSNSARRVILPWMASHAYRRADMFMLSHDDADHSGGAPLLIKKAAPHRFTSSMHETHPLNQLALQHHSATEGCHTLKKWAWDGVIFQSIGLQTPAHSHQKLKAKNNQSCVIKISNATHSVLLTGDIEAVSEMQLLAQHGAERLQSRVLVVPHHGSKTSSTLPFLQAVRPEIALIQAGWQNQFGHPHKQVIERYASMNVQVHNTAQNGAMKWIFKPGQIAPTAVKASELRQTYWHTHESGAKAP
jgi:competence protein ComEC